MEKEKKKKAEAKSLNTAANKAKKDVKETAQEQQVKEERDGVTKKNERNINVDVKSFVAAAKKMKEYATLIAEFAQQLQDKEEIDGMNNKSSDSETEDTSTETEDTSKLRNPLQSSSSLSDEIIGKSSAQDIEMLSEASSSQETEPMSISEPSSSQESGQMPILEGSSQNSEESPVSDDADVSSESDSEQNVKKEKPKSSSGLGGDSLELSKNEETVPERNFSLRGLPLIEKVKKFI